MERVIDKEHGTAFAVPGTQTGFYGEEILGIKSYLIGEEALLYVFGEGGLAFWSGADFYGNRGHVGYR